MVYCFYQTKTCQGAYRGIPCYYIGSIVHECCDGCHVIDGSCHAVFSLYLLALLVTAFVTAIIRLKRLWPISLAQKFQKGIQGYYYYDDYHHHHRISHFSALAGKYSPILGCSNQQD